MSHFLVHRCAAPIAFTERAIGLRARVADINQRAFDDAMQHEFTFSGN